MIVAAVAESVRAAAGDVEGVELRGLEARMDDVEFLVPQWGTTPDLTAMPALRVVQVMSAGTDWIDPLVPDGVTLCNARGSRDIPVAEWIVGAILGAFTGLLWAARNTRWEYRPPRELSGARVLIVGHGSIGRATAERLEALGAHVTGVGRARLGELRRLAADADVVVNLVPAVGREPRDVRRGRVRRDARRRRCSSTPGGARRSIRPRCWTRCRGSVPCWTWRTRSRCPRITRCGRPKACWRSRGTRPGDSAAADARCVALAVEQLRAYAAGRPLRNVVR